MTINDVMIREIGDAERERKRDEEAEECRRRLFWQGVNAICDAAMKILAVAALMFLAWCLVSETPHKFPRARTVEAAQ